MQRSRRATEVCVVNQREGVYLPERLTQGHQPASIDPRIAVADEARHQHAPVAELHSQAPVAGGHNALGRDALPPEEGQDGTVAPDPVEGSPRTEDPDHPRASALAVEPVDSLVGYLEVGVHGVDRRAVDIGDVLDDFRQLTCRTGAHDAQVLAGRVLL